VSLNKNIVRTKNMFFYILLFFSLLYACKSNDKKDKSIEGIWKSIGYGEILKIDSTTYKYFDITNISCLPSKQGNISEVKNSIVLKNDTLVVKRGYSIYYYARTNVLPDLCKKNINDTNDPLYNFEVFADTYKEHYAFLN
jgi:carboxyl-terminal processing protease